jgi:phosphoglucomutase
MDINICIDRLGLNANIYKLNQSNTPHEITEWDGANPDAQPTQAELEAAWASYTTEYDGNAYQRTRADAYEEVKEQLDQLYHDMTAGKLDATGEWHKAIKAVKDATPKP